MTEKTHVQSILFSRGSWDSRKAKKWLKEHGYRSSKLDRTEGNLRFRQHSPNLFIPGSFRTITFSEARGIKAVIGHPYSSLLANPNPNPEKDSKTLVSFINNDWTLHRKKHGVYRSLVGQISRGSNRSALEKKALSRLILTAAKAYLAKAHRKEKLSELFPITTLSRSTELLRSEFENEYSRGTLNQYVPRSVWDKWSFLPKLRSK